ncbi:hypothetical protein C0585_01260 [Candidatus Woesearchaeota archaeon]|nr:MAG: hypothetical protein C0585_01260 [Candidatus Woesearchaeota archaeon]
MIKKLIFSLIFGIIAYSILLYLIDIETLIEIVKYVDPIIIFIAFLFILFSLFFEFLRWKYYMNSLNIKVDNAKNLLIFLSTLSFGFMPMKSGELLRYYYLKKEKISISKSIPIHFISNLTTFFVVLLFSTPILLVLDKIFLFYAFTTLLILFFFSLKYSKKYIKALKYISTKIKFKKITKLENSLESSKKLLGIKHLVRGFTYTMIYYVFMFFSVFLVSRSLGINFSPIIIFSIYSLSLIIGAISMMPGGVGVVEGSSLILLMNYIDNSLAIALIFLIRFLSLWMTTFIGFVALYLLNLKETLHKK